MSHSDDPEIFEDTLSARVRPVVHNHYTQQKNGNGDVNRIVWGVAAFAVVCLVTINGIMWSKLWTMSDSLARLETQVTILVQRIPQQ